MREDAPDHAPMRYDGAAFAMPEDLLKAGKNAGIQLLVALAARHAEFYKIIHPGIQFGPRYFIP